MRIWFQSRNSARILNENIKKACTKYLKKALNAL